MNFIARTCGFIALLYLFVTLLNYSLKNVLLIPDKNRLVINGNIKNIELLHNLKNSISNLTISFDHLLHVMTQQATVTKPVKLLAKMSEVKMRRKQSVKSMLNRDSHCTKNTFKMIILVLSEKKNVLIRNMIRKSWGQLGKLKLPSGKWVSLNWKLYFVTGVTSAPFGYDMKKLIHEENEDDILEINFMDIPEFRASMAYTALEFITLSCVFDNVLVLNDQQFLNIESLYHLIHHKYFLARGVYMGKILFEHYVIDTNLKKKVFPRHAVNGTFLMSYDVIRKIIKANRIFPSTGFDESFGELVLKAGFDAINIENFVQTKCMFNSIAVVTMISQEFLNYKDCLDYLNNLATKLQGKNVPRFP